MVVYLYHTQYKDWVVYFRSGTVDDIWQRGSDQDSQVSSIVWARRKSVRPLLLSHDLGNTHDESTRHCKILLATLQGTCIYSLSILWVFFYINIICIKRRYTCILVLISNWYYIFKYKLKIKRCLPNQFIKMIYIS